MSIKSKIQALITAANTKTGETDATLTNAVQSLIDGYGGGGSLPSNISKIDGGSFTVAADTKCSIYRIAHNLGEMPKGVYVWCNAFTENTSYTADRLMSCFMGFVEYTNDGSSYRQGEYMMLHRTASVTAYVDSSYFSYSLERFATTSDFCVFDTEKNYISGITYNWIAWA